MIVCLVLEIKNKKVFYFTTARKGVNGRKLSAQTGQYFTDMGYRN